eukprot:s247_g22.t1
MPSSSSRPSALRPLCQWSEGCPKHARTGGYCSQHAIAAARDDTQRPTRSRPSAFPESASRKKPRVSLTLWQGCSAQSTVLQPMSLDNYTDQQVLTLTFGALTHRCAHCLALYFAAERNQSGKFTLCCKNGKASNLPGVSEAPEPLRSFLTGKDPAAKLFRQHIRRYNAAMSFVSFGANLEIKTGNSGTSAPPVCIVHGAVYHHSYPLRAIDTEEPKFAQFYLYDTLEATQLRNNRDPGLQTDILADLDYMLHAANNPYVDAYRRMGELTNNLDPVTTLQLGFAAAADADLRRYNHPQGEQLAVVFQSDDGAPPSSRDLVVWPRDPATPIHRIAETNEHVDPLTYALLFPDGMPGWHEHLQHSEQHQTRQRHRLTAGQFYTYRIMIRQRNQLLPHGAGLLFQQYILDAYCRAEAMRMAWLRQNQHQLRAETLAELDSFVHDPELQRQDEDAAPCGVPIILPASFAGSPRNIYQLYLDAMAIVRKHGRPDFFITFTANPQWPEIQANLLPGQIAADRPDLVARVFHIRLKALLKDLTDLHLLGEALAWSWVIEFQKRGLPHAHILLVLFPKHRIQTAADVDRHVAAEIPWDAETTQAELAEIVGRCMMHGPCGARNPCAPCIQDDGLCKARYPKEFQSDTILRADGYPLYRRRDNGMLLQKAGTDMDNRDVVPYSPVLLKRHNAHLNVEVVSSIRLVKYIFKYTFKGHDRARIEVSDRRDEIQEHLDARYLGATEAAWRLFEFPLHGQSHSVQRLIVHLPQEQMVTFQAGAEEDALLRTNKQRTTLTAWFDLNAALRGEGDDYVLLNALYQDVPLHCTWQQQSRTWKKRARGGKCVNVVGRVAPVAPTEGERYFLYLLLLAVPGATSFAFLRTVRGHEHSTFQAAAVALGLCDSDEHFYAALRDVLQIASAASARAFFATVLACCDVADPLLFWTTFAVPLSEDFLRDLDADTAQNAALADIQNHLRRHNRTTADFHIPLPKNFDAEAFRLRELRAELAYYTAAEATAAAQKRAQMEPGSQQAAAFDAVQAALDTRAGAVFLIDGPGGTGKSFLFQALLHSVRGRGDIAVACSWNGLAASLLPGGRTCHARFGFPVSIPQEHVPWRVKARTGKGQVLIRTSLLLWDEVVTAPAGALDAADACLRDLCQCDKPFGGKVVVLGGDLRQTLPVLEHADRSEIIANAITGSMVWANPVLRRVHLSSNIRTRHNVPFQNFLLQVGDGRVPYDADLGQRSIVLPNTFLAPSTWNPTDLILFAFGDVVGATERALLRPTAEHLDDLAQRAILAPKNDHVRDLNNAVLAHFPADGIMDLYGSSSLVAATQEDLSAFPPDYLNSLELPDLPPHCLRLCRGALISLLRNLDYERGLCNDTRCLVVRVGPRVLDVLVLSGTHQGHRAFIPRIPLSLTENTLTSQDGSATVPSSLSMGHDNQ